MTAVRYRIDWRDTHWRATVTWQLDPAGWYQDEYTITEDGGVFEGESRVHDYLDTSDEETLISGFMCWYAQLPDRRKQQT